MAKERAFVAFTLQATVDRRGPGGAKLVWSRYISWGRFSETGGKQYKRMTCVKKKMNIHLPFLKVHL